MLDKIKCARCNATIEFEDDAEFCWFCGAYLCYDCWDEFGHCGHPAADEENQRTRERVKKGLN